MGVLTPEGEFLKKVNEAVDSLVGQIKENPEWAIEEHFEGIFDCIVSDDSEIPILVGKEVCRRMNKECPW